MMPIHTILHPTDFSPQAETAFNLACALARDYGARLIVMHVWEPPPVIYGDGYIPTPMPDTSEIFRSKLENLRAADPTLPPSPLRRLRRGTVAGPPNVKRAARAVGTKTNGSTDKHQPQDPCEFHRRLSYG